jgi:phosphoserine aminotransferase
MNERIYNFSAGPAVLPVSVLEQAQAEMLSLPGVGMSVMEISHRSKHFDAIFNSATQGMRDLLGLPDNYHVLFLQGGASLQFSMIPMNLLPDDKSADYIVTGSWGKKAVKEAKREGKVSIAATTEEGNFKTIPAQTDLQLNADAAYCHFTTNETIQGVQFQETPDSGSVPLIADASSDILSRPVPTEKYAMIYAGAQKNLGPAGVTVVIIRDDLLAGIPDGLHTMLDYRTHVENKSLYNTPNTWGIYIIDLVCKWIKGKGGLEGMAEHNRDKANVLYNTIDSSDFFRGHAETSARSNMIVTFRLPSEDLEKQFVKKRPPRN